MKKIIIVFLYILCFSFASQAQLARHAKGSKMIGFNFSFNSTSNIFQPHINYFFNSKLNMGLNVLWENYSAKIQDLSDPRTETGFNFLVKPVLNYSFYKIKNIAYFNLSAGLNIGKQTYEYYNHRVSPRTIHNSTSDIQIGPNIGLNCDVYLIKNILANVGAEYMSIPGRLYGDDQINFVIGLAYNF